MIELRDSIAIEAMKELLRSFQDEGIYIGDDNSSNIIASLSYKMADAMLVARNTNDEDIKKPLDFYDLGLTVRAMNILRSAEIDTVSKLLATRENDLFKLPLCGRKVLNDIKDCLKRFNLSLA